jgi:hypothetical protein
MRMEGDEIAHEVWLAQLSADGDQVSGANFEPSLTSIAAETNRPTRRTGQNFPNHNSTGPPPIRAYASNSNPRTYTYGVVGQATWCGSASRNVSTLTPAQRINCHGGLVVQ